MTLTCPTPGTPLRSNDADARLDRSNGVETRSVGFDGGCLAGIQVRGRCITLRRALCVTLGLTLTTYLGVGANKGGQRVVYRDNVIETTARRIDR